MFGCRGGGGGGKRQHHEQIIILGTQNTHRNYVVNTPSNLAGQIDQPGWRENDVVEQTTSLLNDITYFLLQHHWWWHVVDVVLCCVTVFVVIIVPTVVVRRLMLMLGHLAKPFFAASTNHPVGRNRWLANHVNCQLQVGTSGAAMVGISVFVFRFGWTSTILVAQRWQRAGWGRTQSAPCTSCFKTENTNPHQKHKNHTNKENTTTNKHNSLSSKLLRHHSPPCAQSEVDGSCILATPASSRS